MAAHTEGQSTPKATHPAGTFYRAAPGVVQSSPDGSQRRLSIKWVSWFLIQLLSSALAECKQPRTAGQRTGVAGCCPQVVASADSAGPEVLSSSPSAPGALGQIMRAPGSQVLCLCKWKNNASPQGNVSPRELGADCYASSGCKCSVADAPLWARPPGVDKAGTPVCVGQTTGH